MVSATPPPKGSTGDEVIAFWGYPDEVPTWSWAAAAAGERRIVVAYAAAPAASVAFFINGQPRGVANVDRVSLAARAKVPYEPGVLVAVSLDSTGARLANRSIATAVSP